MLKRAIVAGTVGVFAFVLGGATAVANESGNSAMNCGPFGNPGQAAQTNGFAGRDRVQTPPEFAAGVLGQPSVGAAIQTFCVNPSSQP
jgi:hypothetical protein